MKQSVKVFSFNNYQNYPRKTQILVKGPLKFISLLLFYFTFNPKEKKSAKNQTLATQIIEKSVQKKIIEKSKFTSWH